MYDSIPGNKVSLADDGRYVARSASTPSEIRSALRLRHEVFVRELGSGEIAPSGQESDPHDLTCEHLILINKRSGDTIGTYRLKPIEAAGGVEGFYSYHGFSLETLRTEVLYNGIEIGRACIAPEHRNTRAIFLLWKALARRMQEKGKRYFFGCCSIFTRDPLVGESVYRQLRNRGLLHDRFRVQPRRPIHTDPASSTNRIKLPGLFDMYLRVGARVCGRPAYDEEFGTLDFFVVFDLEGMEPKYRKLFLD